MIETKRLSLRKMVTNDIHELLKIFTDPKVMDAFDAPPFSHGQMKVWMARNPS